MCDQIRFCVSPLFSHAALIGGRYKRRIEVLIYFTIQLTMPSAMPFGLIAAVGKSYPNLPMPINRLGFLSAAASVREHKLRRGSYENVTVLTYIT